jgi:hypothetical protein
MTGARVVIVTDDFVMLNFPKTGSSFARAVLEKLYVERESRLRKLLTRLGVRAPVVMDIHLPKIDEERDYGIRDQHGTLRQIPVGHRHKPVVTITRNPFSRYVSLFLFRWWEQYPPAEPRIILDRYPHFPDLSFSEYYQMEHIHGTESRLRGLVPRIELGLHTIQFIQFYFRDPDTVLRNIDDKYIEEEQYWDDLRDITFLHQENLNLELNEFLLQLGIDQRSLELIDSSPRVNATDKQDAVDYREYFVEDKIENQILERERLLFAIFPEYLPGNNAASSSPTGSQNGAT